MEFEAPCMCSREGMDRRLVKGCPVHDVANAKTEYVKKPVPTTQPMPAVGVPFKVYHVYNTDFGGMGHNVGTVGYFSSEIAAQHVRAQDAFRSSKEEWAIMVNGDIYLLVTTAPIDLDLQNANYMNTVREQALQKLSPLERKALGLDDD